ncbi:hypothetical protein [Allokutzneria albata]|uniref:hypothetical protein n=1 Tax=Allokutzneria albata TaxID=211114 RepID=UPI0012DBD433|nr:hypothetical protein [Allokutzneria albata]
MIDTSGANRIAPWPVADPGAMIRLSAGISAPQVGAVMAALVPEDSSPREIAAALRAITEREHLVAPGGLLARDTWTGVVIPPSCCCGLEEWREWMSVPSGGEPWLGHDPSPCVELLDGDVRIRPDGGLGEDRPPAEQAITASLADFAAQLHSAHQDLVSFLDAVGRWARELAPQVAGDLVAKLDESFEIVSAADGTAAAQPHD